jgi:hypothetical protein
MGRIRRGPVAQHSRGLLALRRCGLLALRRCGLLAQCQARPTATPAYGAGRLSAGRSCGTGARKAAAALSNGGAPNSGASVWTLTPGDGSGHGG